MSPGCNRSAILAKMQAGDNSIEFIQAVLVQGSYPCR